MQLKISNSIMFFKPIICKKYNFKEYNSILEPTLFLGIYNNHDFRVAAGHVGKKIIWFTGTDSMRIKTLNRIRDDNRFKDAIIIAESKWIKNDLDAVGIKYESISLIFDKIYSWRACPLGDSLYWYAANINKYNKYIEEIKLRLPDLNIIITDPLSISHDQMNDIYKKCFVGIRPLVHDGMSQTVAELALMGRYSIWNGDGPFAIHYNNVDDIVKIIKKLREGYNWKLIAKRSRGFFIQNETKWTDLILKLCGLNEIDFLEIFYEAKGRCGSMFRIQRKSDILKIGGLGDSQYQRPWFSEKMIKLEKKQLLVSKHSGYVASEWKNIDSRKGFPVGINFNTKDRGTK